MAEKTISINVSDYESMIYNRIAEMGINHYPQEFWDGVVDYFSKELGWDCLEINARDPMYFVDNISINGDIQTTEEVLENYENLETEADVLEYADEEGWTRIEDYWVISWGL